MLMVMVMSKCNWSTGARKARERQEDKVGQLRRKGFTSNRGIGALISIDLLLSSMDSDADETFFDAQDHAALYGKNELSSLKQKRPCSLGDVDMTGDSESDIRDMIKSEYSARCGANSVSLQCLFDVLPATNKEPKTTDDLYSKSLSEHEIAQMLNAPLALPRSLLKSVSTPSIIAVNDNCEKCEYLNLSSLKQMVAVSPNQDSDEDKPFKRKKRSSLFFKKKWGKEKEIKKSSHQFVSVCYSTSSFCDVCAKSLCNKPALHCDTCLVKVHETCREQISDCSKLKNSRAIAKTASYHLPSSSIKEKLTTSSSFKTPSSGPMFPNASPSHITKNKRQSEVSFSPTTIQDAIQLNAQKHSGSSPSKVINEDKESDMLEDSHMNIVETNSASVESLDDGSGDDSDLDDDADLDLRLEEPEQWSSLVDRKVIKKMKEKDVKRQESIYELILTEKHHVLTLKIMQKIYAHGMKKEVQLSPDVVDRIFPFLDYLFDIHSSFLRQLRERQKEYVVIPTISDLLLQQFQGEKGEQLASAYGEFCSQHQEAVSLYKDILKSDRKFQLFNKKCSTHPLCKTRAVPACMLLVTQRITKYPLVIDGIIKATKENDEEKTNLIEALSLVKGIIAKVNSKVTEKEKEARLIEIYNKVDAKSTAFYHGKKFKKSDLLSGKRKLHYEGTLIWKSARGKPLEVTTVVLSDIIIFLQESNQKYTFVSQDNKSGILSLQKLLVREKAGQDSRGIYLISSNQKEPEMYELGCTSAKDKKVWMENVRYAIDNCPDEEELATNDCSNDRKLIDVKVARIKHLLGSLHDKDMCIAQICEDKMQILLELLEADFKPELSLDVRYTNLLDTKCDPGETRNLLMASLNEASRIASSLYMTGSNLSRSVSSVGEHQSETFTSPALPKRAETFGGFDSPIKEQNPLNKSKSLKKKLMMLKENEKVRVTSVSCTVSPVSEEDGEHLCPAGIHDVRRLSGPPAINENALDQPQHLLKRSTNSTNTLTSIAWGGVIKTKSNERADWTDASSPSMSEDAVSQSDTVGELLSLNAVAPSLLAGGKEQLSAAIQLVHQLNRLQCLFSQHFTSYEILKAEHAQLTSRQSVLDSEPRDLKERRSLYKHNQGLEELRNIQEQVREERQLLEKERHIQNNVLESRDDELNKLQEQLTAEQQDVKEQREKLYKQLEVLKKQGILLSPSMQIVNTGLQSPPIEPETPKSSPQPETVSSWELRATKHDSVRKHTTPPAVDHKPPTKPDSANKQRNVLGSNSLSGVFSKRTETPDRQTMPVHLRSATNQQKTILSPVVTQPSSFKQKLPMKLANLSLGSPPQGPNSENLQTSSNCTSNNTSQSESPQFLPMKLAMEGNRQTKPNPIRTSSFGGSPKPVIPQGGYVHQRAGSSPAQMHGLSQHGDETISKARNSTMPKEKSDKKDVGKKYNNSPEQEIIFF
ncbi:A-kinase anchor protein 13 [Nymphon striatum]|nr:A-kinase anchor protein 13 [Nymphon striatum]